MLYDNSKWRFVSTNLKKEQISNDYCRVVSQLDDQGITLLLSTERGTSARGRDSRRCVVESAKDEDILAELKERGVPATRVHLVVKNGLTLPLVVVYLYKDHFSTNSIFNVTHICEMRVTVEKKNVNLNLDSMAFGPTYNYC